MHVNDRSTLRLAVHCVFIFMVTGTIGLVSPAFAQPDVPVIKAVLDSPFHVVPEADMGRALLICQEQLVHRNFQGEDWQAMVFNPQTFRSLLNDPSFQKKVIALQIMPGEVIKIKPISIKEHYYQPQQQFITFEGAVIGFRDSSVDLSIGARGGCLGFVSFGNKLYRISETKELPVHLIEYYDKRTDPRHMDFSGDEISQEELLRIKQQRMEKK